MKSKKLCIDVQKEKNREGGKGIYGEIERDRDRSKRHTHIHMCVYYNKYL